MTKRTIIIAIVGGVILLVAGMFFLVDFESFKFVPNRPKMVIDTSCPVQPCFKKEEEEKKPIVKKKKPLKKERPWDPFRKPWED